VLDRVGVERAVVVSWCGAGDDLMLAVEHPHRVAGLVLIAPDLLLSDDPADEQGPFSFDEEPQALEGWAKWNRHYWRCDWPGFLDFVFRETFTEPHSTKQIEDAMGWGMHTDRKPVVGWYYGYRCCGADRLGKSIDSQLRLLASRRDRCLWGVE